MKKFFEKGNPDDVGYPCSEEEDWWEQLNQDDKWIAEQEAIDEQERVDELARILFNHEER